MDESGVFTITNNFLNKETLPIKPYPGSYAGWDYNTFGYGFSITFWSRLEIAYCCTLFNSKWSPSYDQMDYRGKILFNQDRHFAAKLLLLKEGEFEKKWIPALAVGVSDPVTSSGGNYIEGGKNISSGNGYFNRFYIVATKHFKTDWGEIGGNFGYQYTKRTDWDRTGMIAAISWRPVWLENRWFNPKFIFEYDSRTPNFGFIAGIWDDRFEAMFCLQNFQWVSFGLRFKLRLKGSE